MSTAVKQHKDRKDFMSLLGSSGTLVAAQIGGVASGFVLMLLLARTIEQEDLGRITTGFSMAMLLAVFTTLNIEAGNFRFLSRYINEKKDFHAIGYIQSGLRLVLGIGLLLWFITAIVWIALQYLEIEFPVYFLLAIFAAPIFGWLRINGSNMHANGHVLWAFIPRSFLRPFILLVMVSVGTAVGFNFDESGIMYLFIVTLLLVALLQNQLYRRTMQSYSAAKGADYSEVREWVRVGLYMLPPIFFVEYSTDIIVVLSSAVLPQEELAILGILLRIVGFLSFGVAAVNMAIGPRLASALGSKERKEANRLLTLGGQMKLWPVLAGYSFLVFYSDTILGIFGPGYQAGETALAILALMPLVLTLFGPTTFSMTVLGLQKWGIPIFLISTIALVILISILGTSYGINGVAVAVVLIWVFWNTVLYGLVRVKKGYDLSLIGSLTRMGKRRPVEIV